ncbi:MAG: hypothetical protein ACOYIF_00350 [Acetivibrionales bacterium]|jgi:hypothetical protein
MYNSFMSFRDAFINRFGSVLGYVLMVFCMLVTLSLTIFLIKFFFKIAAGLLIACCVLYGIYKLRELIKKR